jgi:uncharacterized protein YdeI (YjbR/CyaY-like superfamily)
MPDELAEWFLQDEEFQLVFDKLKPDKKRTLLYLVGKIKSTDIRITKSTKFINYLKSIYRNGKLDFNE